MIEFTVGDLMKADAEAYVNPVNTVGVMGKGLALQFRRAFPQNFTLYQEACARGEVRLGKMLVIETGRFTNPRFLINFPTKRHWKDQSKIEDIESGLKDLAQIIAEHHIGSVAIPALGCGLGGLNWNDMRPLIILALEPLKDVRVVIFEPPEIASEKSKG